MCILYVFQKQIMLTHSNFFFSNAKIPIHFDYFHLLDFIEKHNALLYFVTMLSKLILSSRSILSRVLCGVGVTARIGGWQ